MSYEMIVAILTGFLLIMAVGLTVYKKLPKKLKTEQFSTKWKQIQSFCKEKSQWPEAIVQADQLLDAALKRRKYKGKSMGERMVAAQRIFTSNDDLWFAHNLSKKILINDDIKLKESDVKTALVAFRQALRDLGALDNGEPRNP
jgi:hypothetical protein